MNPKGNSGLLEREWKHHVPQWMDLVHGGTPQQLAPHLPWGFNLTVSLQCLNLWILKIGECLNLLTRLWPQCYFYLLI